MTTSANANRSAATRTLTTEPFSCRRDLPAVDRPRRVRRRTAECSARTDLDGSPAASIQRSDAVRHQRFQTCAQRGSVVHRRLDCLRRPTRILDVAAIARTPRRGCSTPASQLTQLGADTSQCTARGVAGRRSRQRYVTEVALDDRPASPRLASAAGAAGDVRRRLGELDDSGATFGSGSSPEQALTPSRTTAAAMTARVPVTGPIIPREPRERNRRDRAVENLSRGRRGAPSGSSGAAAAAGRRRRP